jgi:hypothetical protein
MSFTHTHSLLPVTSILKDREAFDKKAEVGGVGREKS